MAKKSSKSQTSLIISILVIALAVLTICTLFFNMIKCKVVTTGLGGESTHVNVVCKGADVIKAMFKGEVSVDYSSEVNALISLRTGDDHGFVTTMFSWGYFLTVLVSAASLVFAILGILGMKFALLNKVLGLAWAILALVAVIFAICVAATYSAETGSFFGFSGKSTGYIAIGAYCLFGSMIAGVMQLMQARK